ncbi:MAG: ligase-associated DNA damage response DEXH box helicase [Sphingobacteriales bacterium]|nr:MAG: ligase-associated DNA damage response DEXH box helicase [Sphingobacteriales bacterium]
MLKIPANINAWFTANRWRIRPHQKEMVDAFTNKQSTLLIAPTGTGKTMAGFLASIIDIHQQGGDTLHTLYISPLKALTNDIERNLLKPVNEIGLNVRIETRTGDTPSHKRIRQRKRPPHILLTTPESLMLMLSYPDAPALFANLKLVVIDEIHSIAPSKRGDFLALALARLTSLAPQHLRFGLSATVADPAALAAWLGPVGHPAKVLEVKSTTPPNIQLLQTKAQLPYGGFMARYALPEIYTAITKARTSIIFVNTRSQCERTFQLLWEANREALPIAIYHGSLTKEQRRKTEAMMAEGKLRAIVATAALELGIDWGDVDLVINIGAPKGVSRLLQRVGRSNHRMDEPSAAYLVPANHFEVLECQSAIQAIHAGQLDGEPMLPGGQDVVVQFIINCACSGPVTPAEIYAQVIQATPYAHLTQGIFELLFSFAIDGGYVLKNYDRYARLVPTETGAYTISSRGVASRHRLNIGVITDAARLSVKRITVNGRSMGVIGQVEESFAQGLVPGDTFLFAGEVLEFVRVKDMFLEARRSKAKQPKIPSYAGSNMPLSTFLAEGVRHLLQSPQQWQQLPPTAQEWLALQQGFSRLPGLKGLLVEHFDFQKRWMTMIYTFEGRRANQTLGMLVTRRMERHRLKPLGFSITDYALSIVGLEPMTAAQCQELLNPDILVDDLEAWLMESPMLKRSFRRVAMVSGIAEQRHGGTRKTMKQLTFSTDLVYDVLRRHEPDHILLKVARDDAERELLDVERLAEFLIRMYNHIDFNRLDRPSPMAIPILFDVRREAVLGEGLEHLLHQHDLQAEAEILMEDVRDAVAA